MRIDCINNSFQTLSIFPPEQIRFNECIGCQICARVCTKLIWDAIRMIRTKEFETIYNYEID